MDQWNVYLDSVEKSRFFWMENSEEGWRCGNPDSRYREGADPFQATYDTGNNKVITISAPDGSLKEATFFKDCCPADHIPGVWMHKSRIKAGPFRFPLWIGGERLGLGESAASVPLTAYRTELLACAVPVTEYRTGGLRIRLLSFAPLAADGSRRPRAFYYILLLQNLAAEEIEARVGLPFGMSWQDVDTDNAQISVRFTGEKNRTAFLEKKIAPGGELAAAVRIGVFGEEPGEREEDALYWLKETLAYYRGLFRRSGAPEASYFGELMKRCLCQCQQCLGMLPDGELAGSSWGTNPFTTQIWMRDLYYSMLPLLWCDPALFRQGILWFFRYGVRPAGMRMEGGIGHSAANSVNGLVMAGLYYRETGDDSFFTAHPQLREEGWKLLEGLLALRKPGTTWLFPSRWLSDGLCAGDYHTGTNLAVWCAFDSFGRVLEQAYGDREKGETCRRTAAAVREAILQYCVVQGPFGPQLAESVGDGPAELWERMKAGSREELSARYRGFGAQFYEFYNVHIKGEPYLVHDGEESDTTLAALYGFCAPGEPLLQNGARFALSEHNPFYRPVSGGILWEDCADATFPGYVTGLLAARDEKELEERLRPFRELADLDGSLWWWPYPYGAADESAVRREPGKCGWACGTFLALAVFWLKGRSGQKKEETEQG